MASPRTVKEVLKLTGRIAAHNRFISKATNNVCPSSRHWSRHLVGWTSVRKPSKNSSNTWAIHPSWVIQGRRKLEFTLVSVSYSYECCLDSRRRQKIAPNLLCQPGLPRGRSQIPTQREDFIRFDCNFTQAAPQLPSEPYLGDDWSTYKEVNEQARGCKKDDPMGYWA